MKTHFQIQESERLPSIISLYLENCVLYPISELVESSNSNNINWACHRV